MFTAQELVVHLARIERERRENDLAAMKDADAPFENPAAALERTRQFDPIKELLTANMFGTSVSGTAVRQPEAPNREVLAGLVERVTFHNADARVLRSAHQGTRPSRSRDGRRPRRHGLDRGVDNRIGGMDQRPHPWSAVQGALHAHLGAIVDRGHREIPQAPA